MRRLSYVALVAALCVPAAAQDQDDLARLFPTETIVYAEADAGALMRGLPKLQLAGVLNDPKLRQFLQPGFEKLGIDPNQPVASLLEMMPVKQWVKGRVAAGVSGLTFRIAEETVRVSVHDVIGAKHVNRILGALAVAGMQGQDPERIPVHVAVDFALVAEPGPMLKEMVRGLLAQPHRRLQLSDVKLGERTVKHFRYAPDRLENNLYFTQEFYADLSGDRWFFASSADTLARILGGGPRASLGGREAFASVRDRMTRDDRILFVFADVAEAAKIFQGFVPPIAADLAAQIGVMSIRGAGLGVSITGGGVRESVGLLLDGEPRGAWRLLDALPGGMRSLELAPAEAMAVVGAKFDGKLLLQRTKELLAELAPGTEQMVSPMLARAMAGSGFDFEKDILGAFGDEVAVIMLPPEGFGLPVPQTVIGIDLGDEAAFRKILARGQALAKEAGEAVRIQPIEIVPPAESGTGGISGWQVLAPLPIQPPTFAIHKGHFFGASGKALLAKVCQEWGGKGKKSLVKDNEVFKQVLQGLNSGESTNLVMLAYVDLRKLVPMAFQSLQMFMVQLPRDWVDIGHMPDINTVAQHLTGVAFGLRKDGRGIILDSFSQSGLLIPGLAWSWYEQMVMKRDYERWMREQEELKRLEGQVQSPDAPFWGLQSLSTDGRSGITVLGTFEKGPARVAGIVKDDVILAINEAPTRSLLELRRATLQHKPGETVKVKLRRGGAVIEVEMTFVRRGDFFPDAGK